MKLKFRFLVPEEDICDRCIYLINDEQIDIWGSVHNFRCVNADRIKASSRNERYWDKQNKCKFYSPIGGCKKI